MVGGLLVKVEGDVVNLVHESAKEFFQSDQVNIREIDMFHMGQETHMKLMQTCLAHVECGYGNSSTPGQDPFLSYASQYWPVHFHHAIHVIDSATAFSRPFFRVKLSFFSNRLSTAGTPAAPYHVSLFQLIDAI